MKEFYSQLEKELKIKFGEDIKVWVWGEISDVKGFYGTGKVGNSVVIWITERPSSARFTLRAHSFPDKVDEWFYGMLKEESLENIHLTDFVKIMADSGIYPTQEELKINAEWMKKEIENLMEDKKKLIIIANTRRVVNRMKENLPNYQIIYKPFFKHIFRFNSKEKRDNLLREILRDVKIMADNK
ncbi:MAG: hypothetical protein NTU63_01240 [Candidatus Pacearchaeota archaeon]|nr:hypothetical protein [Candidatus Pacearchaeota archaeon]